MPPPPIGITTFCTKALHDPHDSCAPQTFAKAAVIASSLPAPSAPWTEFLQLSRFVFAALYSSIVPLSAMITAMISINSFSFFIQQKVGVDALTGLLLQSCFEKSHWQA